MERISRRGFLRHAGGALAGAGILSVVPAVLYRSPWAQAAVDVRLPTVQATFTALVEAVTTVADEAAGAAIAADFDRALPPLPQGAPSSAVTAILDARTASGAHGATFASAEVEARREVLAEMVRDEDPDMRQLANQLIPFASFMYFNDRTLDEIAEPGGPTLPQWDEIGFPGPSDGYLDSYQDGTPAGFRASPHRGR